MASTDPQIDLIENGIQTVQFIQNNRDEIQKTYGRSAISKPGTKERATAWEAYIESKIGDAAGSGGRGEGKDGNHEASGTESNSDNGQGGRSTPLPEGLERGSTTNRDNKGGDGEDSTGLNSGTGEISGREGSGANRGGDPISKRTDGAEGGNPDNEIADSDYDRINLLDQATEDHLAGREIPGKLEVREAKPSDIAEILGEEASKTHRRLRGIRNLSKSSESEDSDLSPVKKGIDGNTASMSSKGRLTSGSGAIRPVHLLPSNPISRSASADSARRPVRTVREISSDDDTSGLFAASGSDDISNKLDRVLENQTYIIQRLNLLAEMNEEIKGIKKILTNHSLTLSTLESYINDLMIVIPKSGDTGSDGDQERNPDLRMVVGRDHSRGLNDVTKNKKDVLQFGEELGSLKTVDRDYLQDPLDFSKNNAANFVPDEGPISRSIIYAMIRKRVKDPKTREELMDLVNESEGELPMRDMYYQMKEYINQMVEDV
uniref:Phosphoprotein n=1 Tax=Jeilongvirus sp. TaxID=2686070 RepID=A0A8F7GNX7_9MONO|nr:P/V/W protein [Jeilongvirus sp.]QXU63479.1 P/V/W protein [Jeilongvirus sp.]